MAQIVINEISQNYTYNIGTSSYATVALPITSCWGPGYFDPKTYYGDNIPECDDPHEFMLEHTAWQRFPATQKGLESFVATYRGPASVYRRAKDYSYQMAMTLLTSGYDVLVCRLCPGTRGEAYFTQIPAHDYPMFAPNKKYTVAYGEGDAAKPASQVYHADDDGNIKLYQYVGPRNEQGAAILPKEDGDKLIVSQRERSWNPDNWEEATGGQPIDVSADAAMDPESDIPLITFKAKYPGTFGNNIQVTMKKNTYFDNQTRSQKIYWNVITHIVDVSGIKTSVENISLVFNVENSTDTILYYKEVDSKFWDIMLKGEMDEGENADSDTLSNVKVPHPIPVDLDGNYVSAGSKYPGLNVNVEDTHYVRMSGGDDIQAPYMEGDEQALRPYDEANEVDDQSMTTFERVIKSRYEWAKMYNVNEDGENYDSYPQFVEGTEGFDADAAGKAGIECFTPQDAEILFYREWLFTHLVARPVVDFSTNTVQYEGVFDLLKDKLAYNPNRVIASGWDDQDFTQYFGQGMTFSLFSNWMIDKYLGGEDEGVCPDTCLLPPSPLHLKLMDVAYYSRCATSLIDIPHVVDRKYVHIEDEYNLDRQGYTQKLARVVPYNASLDVNGTLYHTHSALFAPWGQYTYVGTGKMTEASPAFLALMIQRAQILNQPNQYEWALPTNRKHNLKIGKLDYTVPKKILDKWQKLDGASVNVITTIPDLGTNIWGNSTLFEVPPSTYQALANLSTRYLVNAVENVAYKCGVGITFQYNNEQAYNKFYAGVTPLLDTMKNVGAIEDYYVKMAADINGLDQVNANTVVGKIYLVVYGVINDIIVDLIALPPGVDLNQYES